MIGLGWFEKQGEIGFLLVWSAFRNRVKMFLGVGVKFHWFCIRLEKRSKCVRFWKRVNRIYVLFRK